MGFWKFKMDPALLQLLALGVVISAEYLLLVYLGVLSAENIYSPIAVFAALLLVYALSKRVTEKHEEKDERIRLMMTKAAAHAYVVTLALLLQMVLLRGQLQNLLPSAFSVVALVAVASGAAFVISFLIQRLRG